MKNTYAVLEDVDHDDLAENVSEWMRLGWKPIGGVAVESWWSDANERREFSFFQAMVHENWLPQGGDK